jgi:hypothetical protein
MKLQKYSKELLGNGDLPGALGFEDKISPVLHLDKKKSKVDVIPFGKQANDIHVGIIGYQVSHPFSPGSGDGMSNSPSKRRPGTTNNAARGMSNSSPSMQALYNSNNPAVSHVCFRCFVIYSNILAIYDDDSGVSKS